MTGNVAKAVLGLLLIVVIILAIIFGPIVTIWAINTLFGLNIPTTFATWFATLWLFGGLGTALRSGSSNK